MCLSITCCQPAVEAAASTHTPTPALGQLNMTLLYTLHCDKGDREYILQWLGAGCQDCQNFTLQQQCGGTRCDRAKSSGGESREILYL
ncbi:hypothetical protein EXN66_Car020459 [Channa argus]|uniref:Uncharacterized protein n=1 Tax=Channa argus TaxID=215402 RepID=A0A6G1QR13_CHAAH|nr:hypothetical protein EXN66_Car020459 [Channa argus]